MVLATSSVTIHSGYDKMIYTSDGVRYSDEIVVTIDDASIAGNMLTIEFSAESVSAGSMIRRISFQQ